MSRLALINLLLLAAIVTVGWKVYGNWRDAETHRAELLARQVKTAPLEPLAIPAPPAPVLAAAHAVAAEKMLFTADRNPLLLVEVAPPPQMPALPTARGVVDLGEGPVALLSPEKGQPFKGFAPGQMVSDFKVLSVSQDEIVLAWNGQTIRKRVSELVDQEVAQAVPGARTAAATAAPKPVRQEPKGPGTSMGAARACQEGDNSPPGAERDGFRKVVSATPFGQVCRWEPVQ